MILLLVTTFETVNGCVTPCKIHLQTTNAQQRPMMDVGYRQIGHYLDESRRIKHRVTPTLDRATAVKLITTRDKLNITLTTLTVILPCKRVFHFINILQISKPRFTNHKTYNNGEKGVKTPWNHSLASIYVFGVGSGSGKFTLNSE